MFNAKARSFALAATGALAAPSAIQSGSSSSSSTAAQLGPNISGSNTLHYCSDPADYKLTITDASFNPLPPVPGQNLTSTITGNLKQSITDGATYKVEYGKIEGGKMAMLGSNLMDVCQNLDNILDAIMKQFGGKKCPIEAGKFDKTRTEPVPEVPKLAQSLPQPTGEFYVKSTTTLKDGSVVACIVADLKAPEGKTMSGN